MSASHARGSRGIDELSRFLDSPTQVRVANCAHLNKVDPTSKQCLHGHQKTQVRVGAVGVRHVVEFDEKVDVARVSLKSPRAAEPNTSSRRTRYFLHSSTSSGRWPSRTRVMGSLKLYHRRPPWRFLRRQGGRGGRRKAKARLAPHPAVAAISRLACNSSATAVTEAPQSIEGADVDAGRAEPGRAAVCAARYAPQHRCRSKEGA